MKKNLTLKETIAVSSMLFGMFFGAGNLIFPVHMGQLAGSNIFSALLGFVLTGVGLPLLGVAALGKSHSSSLREMASRGGNAYSLLLTCVLYLTIGPFFAVPRCATTSFTVGLEPILGESKLALFLFSAFFFAVVLLLTLHPGKILTWVGKVINPAFLLFLGTLVIISLVDPPASVREIVPDAAYQTGSFFNGFLEGYNTMDAIAALAFGIIVVDVIKDLGIKDSEAVASSTIKAGIFSCLFMAIIYLGVSVMGTQSRGLFETSANGGIALAQISGHYLGTAGQLFLAVTVTLACLKTAIGLMTSISQAFADIFTKGEHYKAWAIGFCFFSFGVANIGLNSIIKYAVPVLMFLYPLAITLILLALTGDLFGHDKRVYVSVTLFTLAAAFFDMMNALGITALNGFARSVLPFFDLGMGWIVPAILGLIIGLILRKARPAKKT